MSPNINLLATRATFAPLEHRRLAWSFVTFAYPEPMLPLMRYINFERADEADFTVGGRTYTTFAHDWRVESFEAWWDSLCERSLSTEPVGAEPPGLERRTGRRVCRSPNSRRACGGRCATTRGPRRWPPVR